MFYMNTWDDEKSVAFAQAAFLGLPQNIQKDGAYTISFDKSLDCAESCGWHLRYNGQLVADFVNYKNKPKALLTFGYRDGIPQPLAVASQRSAPVDMDKFTKSTCLGCHGFGREKKDFKNDYKDLSTGAIQSGYWVPCHWCKGTGLW